MLLLVTQFPKEYDKNKRDSTGKKYYNSEGIGLILVHDSLPEGFEELRVSLNMEDSTDFPPSLGLIIVPSLLYWCIWRRSAIEKSLNVKRCSLLDNYLVKGSENIRQAN